MANRITKAERDNCDPGVCTTCGADSPAGRNTAGQCHRCHNAAVADYRIKRAAWLEECKRKGREYWAKRGIKVGQRLQAFAGSWFGLGGEVVFGIAQVGAKGAYVSSKSQAGCLDPNYFHPIKESEPAEAATA